MDILRELLKSRYGTVIVVIVLVSVAAFVLAPPPPGASGPPRGAGMDQGGVQCESGESESEYSGSYSYTTLTATPLRGNIACITKEALSQRSSVTSDGSVQVPTNVYGPFEAGFTAMQPVNYL